MDLINLLAEYGPWAWIVGGIVLLAVELVVPGGVFVWLGAAAVATGLVDLVWPLSLPLQWALFGLLSLLGIFFWLKFWRNRADDAQTDSPFLNRRAARFVGHETELAEPIKDGFGRLKLDDTMWRISGPDLPAGARIRVIGYEAAVLSVEAVS